MGVAVITSTCGETPLSMRRLRCRTPKRCCSSTMTRPSFLKAHRILDQRVGADDDLRRAAFDAGEGFIFGGAFAPADD